MANEEHLAILRQGVEVWNRWRLKNDEVRPDLSSAYLEKNDLWNADLSEVDLSGANLVMGDLSEANLMEANLAGAYLNGVDLRGAYLRGANLSGAHLNGAHLWDADLTAAYLRGADLSGANLSEAFLIRTDLSMATLRGADLSISTLIMTNLTNADLTGSRIFGVSAWKVILEGAKQENLIITDDDEPVVTVDNLEVAQFVYLLLHNEKIRHVIDTITTKAVLILGRFTDERKAVLEAIREELRKRDYVPILFDFDKPSNRNLTETVTTLARMARFVIADLSDPHSVQHELKAFVTELPSVPVQPIFCPVKEHPEPFPMFGDYGHLEHVLPIITYKDSTELLAVLSERVIAPAEAMVTKIRKV